jgi:hypothetical protein
LTFAPNLSFLRNIPSMQQLPTVHQPRFPDCAK